jgi:cellulose synthase/poly-beta-1,6-N-acetylglucosamine synthase-like glycosyltransferase
MMQSFETQYPLVSVLVAAWNEADDLPHLIESFLQLDYPAKELILCAGGSDGTFEVAQRYTNPCIAVLEQQAGEGKQKALAHCLERAAGTIIHLTDADCILNTEAFTRTVNPILRDEAVAASGASRPLKSQQQNAFAIYQWAVDRYSAHQLGKNSPGFKGANSALRVDVLRQVGGFNAPASTGTDYTLARQIIAAGYSIRNVPESEVETRYPVDVESYYLKRSRWLRNLLVIGWRTRDRTQFTNGLKSCLIGWAFIGMPFLAIVLSPAVLIVWMLLWGYACASRVRYVRLSGVPVTSHFATVTAAFGTFWLDVVVWSSTLLQIINPMWRRKWG